MEALSFEAFAQAAPLFFQWVAKPSTELSKLLGLDSMLSPHSVRCDECSDPNLLLTGFYLQQRESSGPGDTGVYIICRECHGKLVCPLSHDRFVYLEEGERFCPEHAADRRLTVNVYCITRHYGGPEEGGWWYNLRICACSVPAMDRNDVEAVKAFLRERFVDEGDINSVLGGEAYDIVAEYGAAESEDTKRPHYE